MLENFSVIAYICIILIPSIVAVGIIAWKSIVSDDDFYL